jgi:hypothetical protein
VYRKTYNDFTRVAEEIFTEKRNEAIDYCIEKGLEGIKMKQKLFDSRIEALKELHKRGYIRLEISSVSF